MQTETIIRASAQVARITELHVGDVYKRLETPSYGGETNVVFGIVTDVVSNGEDAALMATEISKQGYGMPTVKELKVFSSLSNVALFPASPEEIAQRFADYRDEFSKKIREAQTTLDKAREDFRQVDVLLSRVESQDVTLATPAHDTFPPGWTPAAITNGDPATPADGSSIEV